MSTVLHGKLDILLIWQTRKVDHGTVTYLEKIDFLLSNLLEAHSVWVNDIEIRVHLQYAGHPIANDMLYLGESVGQRSTEGTRVAARSKDSISSKTSENKKAEEESFTDFTKTPRCTRISQIWPLQGKNLFLSMILRIFL
ncbi:hypothetical protein SOVF_184630 [Spinacia oleracea]|nr:hypothetical protein SOVF_184630 [Spinacia oleracea]